jgi:hypothetical protein
MRTRKVAAGALLLMAGCSVATGASHSDPVDMKQFMIGESRFQVIGVLGAPRTTIQQGANSCDVYRLDINGPAGRKAAIAPIEAVADVLRLGSAEVASSHADAATRSETHAVTMCYGPKGTLVSQNVSD